MKIARTSGLIVLAALAFFTTGQATQAEDLDLRTQCPALGKKILGYNHRGPDVVQNLRTHYNELTNHCYVEIKNAPANPDKAPVVLDNTLYDGQTGNTLAMTWHETDASGKEKSYEGIFADLPTDGTTPGAYIDNMMSGDRRR